MSELDPTLFYIFTQAAIIAEIWVGGIAELDGPNRNGTAGPEAVP
jgi:hypothetical protein